MIGFGAGAVQMRARFGLQTYCNETGSENERTDGLLLV